MNFADCFTILTDLTIKIILGSPRVRSEVDNRFDLVLLVLKLNLIHELVAHDSVSQVIDVVIVMRELNRLTVFEDYLAEAFREDMR